MLAPTNIILLRDNAVLAVFSWLNTVRAKLLKTSLLAALALLLNQSLALPLLLSAYDVAHGSSSAQEVGMVGVDVGALNGDQRLHIRGARAQPLPQQIRYRLDEPGL